jgi:glycolate oxidase iron-sulfur subunit
MVVELHEHSINEIDRCVHCGLCTSACPTFIELRQEADSPRGRIYLMHAMAKKQLPIDQKTVQHIELCLDCRACETACPSGVRYGRILEPVRLSLINQRAISLKWGEKFFLFHVFPYSRRVRMALWPVRLLQQLRLYHGLQRMGVFRVLPGIFGKMATLVNPHVPRQRPLPDFLPAKGRRRARVALFVGCVGEAMFRHIHWATLRVLQENGCDVLIPRGQGCCGAIHYHAGDGRGAKRLAEQNVRSFPVEDLDAVIVNHAGCGAMLKEYPHYWKDGDPQRYAEFSGKVRDICEFLDDLGMKIPENPLPLRVTYHDACHLAHAQKIRHQPRALLSKIPGLELVPLYESELCCGSAGSYNLLQDAMATRLVKRKVDRIVETGAQAVVTANAGCLLHIGREVRRRRLGLLLAHPLELLDWSYRGVTPPQPGFDVEYRP